MGVLADIYSGGNTLKRRLNALVDDPAGTLALGVTRFGEDQNELLNLLTNAYPMAGERTVLNSPEQVDAGWGRFPSLVLSQFFNCHEHCTHFASTSEAYPSASPPVNGEPEF